MPTQQPFATPSNPHTKPLPLKPLSLAIALISGLALPGLSVHAENILPAADMDKLVVTAVRANVDESQVARPLVIVDQEKIAELQPASTAEALSGQTNIETSGGPRASNQTVNIRGLEGQQVLQIVDGVRQNYESGHRPTYFLDPILLRNIEVLKGPTSSLWGSGAIGGVVAQNTVNASDILKPDQDIGGLLKYGYNNNGEASATTLAAGARGETVDLLASAYYRDGNDIELGDSNKITSSTLPDSGNRDQGALLKGQWQITDSQNIGLNLRQSEANGSVPTNGAAPVGTSNFLINRHTDNQNVALDYQLDTASPLVNAQALLYHNKTNMDESRLSDGRSDSTKLDTLGLNLNNRSDFDAVSLLYGIDGYHDDFSADRGGTSRPTPPDASLDVSGEFVQATVPLIKDVLRTELGVRHDSFETEADNLSSSRDDSAVSPSAALIWQADKWLELAVRYDEAFRAPSAEELYTTGTHFCMFPGFCNTFVSNPDLDPENAANKELLARMNWSGVLASDDSLNLKTSIFRNDVDHFIEQIVTDPTFFPVMDPGYTTWVNVDKARLEGFEIEANYNWQNLNTRLGYGQTQGENRKTGDALSGIPANKWVMDTGYEFLPEQNLIAGVRMTHASTQDHVPAIDGNGHYDGYTLTDIYASWQPVGDSLTLNFSVNNLTDKYYRVAFQELYQPGREVLIGATYRF